MLIYNKGYNLKDITRVYKILLLLSHLVVVSEQFHVWMEGQYMEESKSIYGSRELFQPWSLCIASPADFCAHEHTP